MRHVSLWSLYYYVLLVITIELISGVKSQEYYPYLQLNNGITDSTKVCSSDEWNEIMLYLEDALLEDGDNRRERKYRHLKRDNQPQQERQLGRCGCTYCWFTGKGCAGKTSSECENDDEECRRRRHQRHLSSSSSIRRRVLSDENNTTSITSTPCDDDIALLNTTLDTLMVSSEISSSCAELLNSVRTFTCHAEVPCELHSINVYDAMTEQVIHVDYPWNGSGPPLCNNIKIGIEAVTLYEHGSVQFRVLSSPPNYRFTTRTESTKPYIMYGNSGPNIYGTYFPVGNYTVMITSSVDPTKYKTLEFTSIAC